MLFSWDERQSPRNLRDRGVDFEFATLIFDGPTLVREDTRRDYGERRVVAVGIAHSVALTVGYTDRTEAGGAGLSPLPVRGAANHRARRTLGHQSQDRLQGDRPPRRDHSRGIHGSKPTPAACNARRLLVSRRRGHPPATDWHLPTRPNLQRISR